MTAATKYVLVVTESRTRVAVVVGLVLVAVGLVLAWDPGITEMLARDGVIGSRGYTEGPVPFGPRPEPEVTAHLLPIGLALVALGVLVLVVAWRRRWPVGALDRSAA